MQEYRKAFGIGLNLLRKAHLQMTNEASQI